MPGRTKPYTGRPVERRVRPRKLFSLDLIRSAVRDRGGTPIVVKQGNDHFDAASLWDLDLFRKCELAGALRKARCFMADASCTALNEERNISRWRDYRVIKVDKERYAGSGLKSGGNARLYTVNLDARPGTRLQSTAALSDSVSSNMAEKQRGKKERRRVESHFCAA
jgi:hypothetical protein